MIYGEFDNNVLRVNGTLQVSNPSGTGYALPASDGTANQVLTTDGSGTVTWQNGSNTNMALARATLSSNQTLATANIWTKVNFDATDFDETTDFDTVNNEFDITANGFYRITVIYTSSTALTNSRTFGIRITRNISGGGVSNLQEVNYKHMNENSRVVRQVSTVAELTNGDTIEIQARVNVASGLIIDNTSRFTSFTIERIK